jgi:N-dimethylarginine dimethylaminohydrolase
VVRLKVREVLVYRPGEEINIVEKPFRWGFSQTPYMIPMQREHDEIMKVLQNEGVKVNYLRKIVGFKPKMYVLRDDAVVVDKKAVACHLSQASRRGEEQLVKITLKELGIKIAGHIFVPGVLEGSDLFFIDKAHAFSIVGSRTNMEGVNHLKEILKTDVTPIQMDNLSNTQFNIINDIAIIDEELSYGPLFSALKEKEYDLVIASKKVVNEMALNFLQIDDNKVVNVKSEINKKLKMMGLDVIEVEIRDLMKGNTGVRNICLPFY